MTKVQAAVGLVQLRKLDGFIAARRRLAKARDDMLEGLPEIVTPYEPSDCEHSYYLYTCLVCDAWAGEKRNELLKMMGDQFGVGCVIANPPVYMSRKYLRDRTPGQRLPISEDIAQKLLCVSIHPGMTDAENEYACASLIECVRRLR